MINYEPERLSFRDWKGLGKTERWRRIIEMRKAGMLLREIAEVCHTNPAAIQRTIKLAAPKLIGEHGGQTWLYRERARMEEMEAEIKRLNQQIAQLRKVRG